MKVRRVSIYFRVRPDFTSAMHYMYIYVYIYIHVCARMYACMVMCTCFQGYVNICVCERIDKISYLWNKFDYVTNLHFPSHAVLTVIFIQC